MKLFITCLMLIVLGNLLSCANESIDNGSGETCLKAKYIMTYCPSDKPLHVVEFLAPTDYGTKVSSQNPDSTRYLAAILELPESVQERETIFFMSFRYDDKIQNINEPYPCQAMYSKLKILICNEVSFEPCQSSLSKQ